MQRNGLKSRIAVRFTIFFALVGAVLMAATTEVPAQPCQENVQDFYSDSACTQYTGTRTIYCDHETNTGQVGTPYRRTTWGFDCSGCQIWDPGTVITNCP